MVKYIQYLVQGKVSQGVTPTVSLAAALLIFVGVGVFAVAIAQVSSHWCHNDHLRFVDLSVTMLPPDWWIYL